MRFLIISMLCFPLSILSQDYTIFGENYGSIEEESLENTMLVLPLHPHYIISEVDKIICPEGMNVQELREKFRSKCSMQITRTLNDSIDALDLFIASDDEEIETLDYVYNALDYRYVEYKEPEPEADKKRFKIKLPKKKPKKVYGTHTESHQGQLKRVDVMHDRYMSATFANPGAVDYLQERHRYSHMLVISQLEIRRNLAISGDMPYIATLHFELMDALGKQIYGGKVSRDLTRSDLGYSPIFKKVIPQISADVVEQLWAQVRGTTNSPEQISDY